MIVFDNVSLRYGTGAEVLTKSSFEIAPHSFQFLTGPSGAGKTTILKLIFTTLKPTRGVVKVFGKNTKLINTSDTTKIRRRIGMVFQDFRLLDHLTTFENVSLPLRVMGQDESTYRAEVVELLKWVGLGDKIHAFPPILSGGEKQRVSIARALIVRPELLLADEPTGNVDPPMAKRLLRLFMELNRSGTSIVIATHDYALMEQINARRLVLDNGQVSTYG